MPYSDPKKQIAYQREWMRRRRQTWIAENGPCAKCGSTEALEVDHVDPSTKQYQPKAIWSLSAPRRAAELSKCQVLCSECHLSKTKGEQTRPIPHGTHSGYSYHGCRCDACHKAQVESVRAWRKSKGPG